VWSPRGTGLHTEAPSKGPCHRRYDPSPRPRPGPSGSCTERYKTASQERQLYIRCPPRPFATPAHEHGCQPTRTWFGPHGRVDVLRLERAVRYEMSRHAGVLDAGEKVVAIVGLDLPAVAGEPVGAGRTEAAFPWLGTLHTAQARGFDQTLTAKVDNRAVA